MPRPAGCRRAPARIAGALLVGLFGGVPVPVHAVDVPQGAERTSFSQSAFETYALPVRRFEPGTPGTRDVSGAVTTSTFRVGSEALGMSELLTTYRTELSAEGFDILFACRAADCGGFDFRFDAEIVPAPAMLIDVQDFGQISAEHPDGRIISILISAALGDLYIQSVTVRPTEPDVTLVPDDDPTVVTATTGRALPDPAGIYRALRDRGYAVVSGIDFETGGAALSANSDPAIAAVASMMEEQSDLSLIIVGHSDDTGGLTGNIALSRQRAEAVRDALIGAGIAAGRLEAYGVGYLAPRASNTTDAGKRANRRVELIPN